MNVRRTVANVVVFTVDWVLIIGWIVMTALLLIFAAFAASAGANTIAGVTIGTAVVAFIYFSLATGVWFLIGTAVDVLKEIRDVISNSKGGV